MWKDFKEGFTDMMPDNPAQTLGSLAACTAVVFGAVIVLGVVLLTTIYLVFLATGGH